MGIRAEYVPKFRYWVLGLRWSSTSCTDGGLRCGMASNDHANPHRAWTGVAEAEGFGPPGSPPARFQAPRGNVRERSQGVLPLVTVWKPT